MLVNRSAKEQRDYGEVANGTRMGVKEKILGRNIADQNRKRMRLKTKKEAYNVLGFLTMLVAIPHVS